MSAIFMIFYTLFLLYNKCQSESPLTSIRRSKVVCTGVASLCIVHEKNRCPLQLSQDSPQR